MTRITVGPLAHDVPRFGAFYREMHLRYLRELRVANRRNRPSRVAVPSMTFRWYREEDR